MSRRSPLAVLAVFSLVGSLLALAVGPAAGKDGEQDDRALYSACPSGSSILNSAGFQDVDGYPTEFENAINCMANYGIMPGLTPGAFNPGVGVTREQMALILIRAAGPAGIEIPATRDQGFQDIGGLSREVRDSINQLAELEITRGTTPNTYVPHTVVNRRQMAQFFTRFLLLAPVGEGGSSVDSVVADDNVFTDIRDLPFDPYNAIRALYELGVTRGATATTYGPNQPVTRAQMAVFISRMLGHTNARPAGISMQVEDTSVTAGDTVDLIISVRDSDHMPTLDELVDIFYVRADDNGFTSAGRCGSRSVREAGDVRCQIDTGDEVVDGDGNLFYTMPIDEDLTVYAWTGDRNDDFDLDSTEYAQLAFSTSKAASNLLMTDDMREGSTAVRYGTTVTFTFQVVDEDEKPIREEDAEFRIETIEENEGRQTIRRARTYSTDSSGQVEISFRLSDPDSDDGDQGSLKIDVPTSDYDVLDKTTVRITSGSNRVRWSDADAEPSRLVLEQQSVYSTASSSGNGARNRVTATLLDQYGNPVRGKRIHFTSDDEQGLYSEEDEQGDPTDDAQNAYRKTTSRSGVASVNYNRDSSATGTETIEASVQDSSVTSEPIEHYWVAAFPNGSTTGEVILHDEERNTLIIEDSSDNVYGVTYDSNDQFTDSTGAVNLSGFKETLEEKEAGDDPYNITVVFSGSNASDVNRFTLT